MPRARTSATAVPEPTIRRSVRSTTTRKPSVRKKKATESAAEFNAAAHYDEIAAVAYLKWLERGEGAGNSEEDWLKAESEVRSNYEPAT